MEPWSQSHPGWRGGEKPTLATFPSSSSILSFVGNKQTHNCRTDQASLLLVRVRCQMAALCSRQLSFKQRFRHAASFHLVALLSPAHGFQGRPALLYQAREKGKHTKDASGRIYWPSQEVGHITCPQIPLARSHCHGNALLQVGLGTGLVNC